MAPWILWHLFKMFRTFILCFILVYLFSEVNGNGLLLLYRPFDISNDCAFSSNLRYDLSFGMGMSDTISLVFRTMSEVDYECTVEIVTGSENDFLMVVIRFPNNIGVNCLANRDAFTVLKKNKCLRLCDLLGERDLHSPYYSVSVKGRIRFRFLSNSSINTDINAHLYQVSAISARAKPLNGCNKRNETSCSIGEGEYCFTSGVVCDGIKNCGVTDWFDERKSKCGLPVERLSYAPVVAVIAAILCALLAASHILLRCLPPLTNSYFIFNANEDNRLCIDPVFKTPDTTAFETDRVKRISLIPVFTSESSSDSHQESHEVKEESPSLVKEANKTNESDLVPRRKNTIKAMTSKIQETFRTVTGRKKDGTNPPNVMDV